jgi:hemerythrin-like metal-binding protein
MTFVQFSEEFHLGHSLIDSQHASLFEAVNQLHDLMLAGTSRQQLGRVLAFLRSYTVEHFATEEAFMAETDYPEMPAHKAQHDELVRQVQELEEKHTAGSLTLSITVMTFLRDWLAQHISVDDRKLAQHLQAR